jgi:energy-coupling factor transporter ATP-binding protein EcfA2
MQLIAITRAVLSCAPIVIVQEPASGLDPESAELIQQALKSLWQGRTVVLISDDTRLIEEADHRIVLEDGLVAGETAGGEKDAVLPVSVTSAQQREAADPFEKLLNNRFALLDLTREQFSRLLSERPDLVALEGESAVLGFPYRDHLVIHYSLPDLATFLARFSDLFRRCVAVASQEETPRGVLVRFHDRSHRRLTDAVFSQIRLAQGPAWVDMGSTEAPKLARPGWLAEGYEVREASFEDLAAIGELDIASGNKPLTEGGLLTLARESRTGQIVQDKDGQTVGFFNLRIEPAGVGVLEAPLLHPRVRGRLVEPVLLWSLDWLSNQGAGRFRQRVNATDDVTLRALKKAGFVQIKAGLTYQRELS